MKNTPIQIHFSKSSKYDNNVNFDVYAILFALNHNAYINVVLNENQTIEDINLLIIQLTEKLEQNRNIKYNHYSDNVVFGKYIKGYNQTVVEATYYLYKIENHE